MSGLASFVTGAVGGYFQGKDWREGVEDRKRKRKMEDERFQWERSNQAYTEEERDWNREDRSHTVSERKREISRRDEEEAFFKSLVDGTEPPTATTGAPPAAAEAAPETATPRRAVRPLARPQASTAAPSPVAAPAAQATPAAPKDPNAPAQVAAAQPPAPAPAPARTIRLPQEPQGTFFSDRAAQIGAPKEVQNLAAAADAAQAALANGQILPEARAEAEATVRAATEAIANAAQPKPAPQLPATAGGYTQLPGTPPGPPPAAPAGQTDALGRTPAEIAAALQSQAPSMAGRYDGRQIKTDPAVVPQVAPAQPPSPASNEAPVALPGSASARTAPAASPMPSAVAADARLDNATRQAAAADQVRQGRVIAASPVADARNYTALQPASPAAPAAADQLPAVTPTTDAGTPQPSLETVTKTTPRTVTPTGKPKVPTKEEAERATGSFLERYAKEKVPEIVKFYVGRGDLAKAEAYQKWADDTLVKEAMRHWASAVHAATIGDDAGFVEGVAAAYNAKGYYDDGYSIVPEASGIQRDGAGNITGAQVTFKDEATGQVFTQDFEGSEDLYRLGIDMLAPEQVFEIGWSRVVAADGVRDAVAKEIAKKGLDGAIKADDVLSAMEKMSKANLQFQGLPVEQQVQLALDFLARFGGSVPGAATTPAADVPVAPRP